MIKSILMTNHFTTLISYYLYESFKEKLLYFALNIKMLEENEVKVLPL